MRTFEGAASSVQKPLFLALQINAGEMKDEALLPAEQATILFGLSPRLMAWSETIWLIDLTPCLTYWRRRAEILDEPIEAIYQKFLTQGFASSLWRAAIAANPWQAILVVHSMTERGLQGLITLSPSSKGQFGWVGRKILQDMSWNTWWLGATAAVSLLTASKPHAFPTAERRMRRAMERLQIKRPWQLQTVAVGSMRRRFGVLLEQLWNWTFCESISEFPWQPFAPKDPILVKRELDTPLCQWLHLEPLLGEDFNALLAEPVITEHTLKNREGLQRLHADDKVTELCWELVRDDLSSFAVSIKFRHPHSLHKESPEQKTALTQAQYAFESQRRAEAERIKKTGGDETELSRPIIGWSLRVEGQLRLPTFFLSLFDDDDTDLMTLIELENLLPVPLVMTRQLMAEWLPEDSFITGAPKVPLARQKKSKRTAVAPRDEEEGLVFPTPGHAAAAHSRPLFVFRSPLTPDMAPTHDRLTHCVFLERVGSKWWRDPKDKIRCTSRDYYLVMDTSKRRFWAYRDGTLTTPGSGHNHEWYLHGLFA